MPIGTELRQRREEAGLSIDDIAERTKVATHKIQALEEGNFEILPEGIYLDSIVRSYAREVGIASEPAIKLVRLERSRFPPRAAATLEFPAESSPQVTDSPSSLTGDRNLVMAPAATREEPERRSPGFGRFALTVLVLFALAGWGAYFYELNRVDPSRSADTSSAQRPPANPDRPTASRGFALTNPNPPTSGGQRAPADANPNPGVPGREATGPVGTTGPQAGSAPVATPTDIPPTNENADTNVPVRDVSGSWTLATRVDRTGDAAFEGVQYGYEIQLQQAGKRVSGGGRRVNENGDAIGPTAQMPISLSGIRDGNRLTLTFSEGGNDGKFVLLLTEDGTMRGRFSSGDSGGSIEGRRLP